jgi:sulfite reductase (ferredoxin)
MRDRSPDNHERRRNDVQAAAQAHRLDGVYIQAGAGESMMLRLRAPAGQWKSTHLNSLAEIAEGSGDGMLHFTTRGDVELHGVNVSVLDQVLNRIRIAGLTGRGCCGDTVRNVVACAGSGLCPEEGFHAAELARRISDEYTGSAAYEHLPRKFKISVSGCEKACACPQIQDIGIVASSISEAGTASRLCFAVYLGGGLGRYPMLGRKVKQFYDSDDVLLFVRAALECFNELGDRRRKQQARLKFLANRIGHEKLLEHIAEKAASKNWGYQI